MSAYYLVQRLEAKPAPHNTSLGFDAFFSLDYMGSSEFEWGAIPKALKAMREKRVVVEPQTVHIDGEDRQVFFVGHKGVRYAGPEMEAWSRGDDLRRPFYGKERTEFPDAIAGLRSKWSRTDAWWDIENNVAWAIDPAVADLLVDAFNTKPVKR